LLYFDNYLRFQKNPLDCFQLSADSGLSRVHSNPRRPEGEWIGRTKDFQNPDGTLKSASQIKKEFAYNLLRVLNFQYQSIPHYLA
jgi:hypothetical protein